MKKYCQRSKIRLRAPNTNLRRITTFRNDHQVILSLPNQYMTVDKRLVKRGGYIFSSNSLLRHDATFNNNTVNKSYNKIYWEWCRSKHRSSSNINMSGKRVIGGSFGTWELASKANWPYNCCQPSSLLHCTLPQWMVDPAKHHGTQVLNTTIPIHIGKLI